MKQEAAKNLYIVKSCPDIFNLADFEAAKEHLENAHKLGRLNNSQLGVLIGLKTELQTPSLHPARVAMCLARTVLVF